MSQEEISVAGVAGHNHGKGQSGAPWLVNLPGEAALVAASNRGTFRRASKLAVSTPIEMVSCDDTQATFVVGEARVELFPGGPNHARCDCPVAATCVHIIAAYLWAAQKNNRSTDVGAEPAAPEDSRAHKVDQPEGSPSHPLDDLLADVLGWDMAEVNKAAGVAAVRTVANESPATGLSVAVEDGALTISWPQSVRPHAPTLVILPGLGMSEMVVSGTHNEAQTRVWRLRALVELFAAQGREWVWPDDIAASNRTSAEQRLVAAQTMEISESLIGRGLSHLGGESIDALSRVSELATLEDLRLLGRLGGAAAAKLRALRQHDDRTTESICLAALAETWALASLIQQTETELPPQLLGGRFREGEKADLGPLAPLAARWWRSPDGSRGFTWYALDTANGEIEKVTTGRAAGSDPGFQAGWTSPLVWGASAKRLSAGIVRLSGAERREDGTLAATTRTWVEQVTELGQLDLDTLAARVNQQSAGLMRTAFGADTERLRLVRPRKRFGLGPIEVDEVAQELLWSVTDSAGETYRLALPANEANARKLSWLANAGQLQAITLLDHRPEAAFVMGTNGLELISLTLTPLDHDIHGGGLWRKLLGRNKERIARTRESTGLQRLLLSVRDILETLASTGAAPSSRLEAILTARTRELDDLGLSSLADALREVLGSESTPAQKTPNKPTQRARDASGRPDPAHVLWAAFLLRRVEVLAD